MKKGVFVIRLPVGNLISEKAIDKYIQKTLHKIKKAIKQIKRSGYIVMIFPTQEKECTAEILNF